jgi:hypothetical protein
MVRGCAASGPGVVSSRLIEGRDTFDVSARSRRSQRMSARAARTCLRQDLHVRFGSPFLERTQGKLQERTRAIIERRPELDGYFDN